MKSLNVDKGTTINELELTLTALEKLVKEKLQSNPNSGFIMAKGQLNEARIRYDKVLKNLLALKDLHGVEGAFSYGICENCTRFNDKGFSNNFGACSLTRSTRHKFQTCMEHSKKNGGYGI